MSVTPEEVLAIAQLARLHLEPAEAERLGVELTSILDHMERLRAVNTEGVEPMTHAVPMRLRMRDDVPEPSLDTSVAIEAAPDRADDLFQVPNIITSSSR